MRYILFILMIGWYALFITAGISIYRETPYQIERDKAFIDRYFKPQIATIDSFQCIHHRLPTEAEFNLIKNGHSENLGNVTYATGKNAFTEDNKQYAKSVDFSKNYIISIWRGEWWEYYNSANKQYTTNNYSEKDGVIELSLLVLIGLAPFLIWSYIRLIRKKKVFA